jgi:hypothetical protein
MWGCCDIQLPPAPVSSTLKVSEPNELPHASVRTALSTAECTVNEVLPEDFSWRQVTETSAAIAVVAAKAKMIERMMNWEAI